MMAFIKQKLLPPTFEGDEKKNLHARILNVILISGVILIGLTLIGNILDSSTPPRNFVIDFCIIGVFLFLRRLLFMGRVQLVAYVSIIATFVFQASSMVSEGTSLAPVTTLFPLLVITSGIFFYLRGIVAAIITSSLIVASIILARHAGILPPPNYTESTFQWFTFTISFVVSGGITYFVQHQMRKALTLAENEVRDRKRAEAELQLQVKEVEILQQELQEQAIRDPLTGLYNRRFLTESMSREIAKAERGIHPLTVLMLDIDHFKRINDTFGHKAGDDVLAQLGALLAASFRAEDIVCRYGGEEFVVVMLDVSEKDSRSGFERIRSTINEMRIPFDKIELSITCSIGVAVLPQHSVTWEQAIERADAAMYSAKMGGRNRVVIASAD